MELHYRHFYAFTEFYALPNMPSPTLNFSSFFLLISFCFPSPFFYLCFFSFLLSFYSSLRPDILFTPSPLFLPHISQIRAFADPVFYVPSSNSSQTSYIYFLSSHSNVKLIFSWYCV